MGVPQAQIDAALAALSGERNEPCEFHVEPENRDAVKLFLALDTQWRVETVVLPKLLFTRRHGIEYGAVPALARGLRIRLTERVWEGLQILEREAQGIYARRENEALRRV